MTQPSNMTIMTGHLLTNLNDYCRDKPAFKDLHLFCSKYIEKYDVNHRLEQHICKYYDQLSQLLDEDPAFEDQLVVSSPKVE